MVYYKPIYKIIYIKKIYIKNNLKDINLNYN